MRLPGIIKRHFFPDKAILTFPSAPRTNNLHINLTFLTFFNTHSKNHAASYT